MRICQLKLQTDISTHKIQMGFSLLLLRCHSHQLSETLSQGSKAKSLVIQYVAVS